MLRLSQQNEFKVHSSKVWETGGSSSVWLTEGKAKLMKEFWIKGTTIYLVPKQWRQQCWGVRGGCASYMELTRLPILKGKGSLGDFPALHGLMWLSFPTPMTSDFPHLNSRSRGHQVKGLSRVQAYYKLSDSLWLYAGRPTGHASNR